MSATEDLLANNEAYVASFGDKADLPLPPGRRPRSWRAWTPVSTSTAR